MRKFYILFFSVLVLFVLISLANAELLDSWDDERAYKPIPVLFLHGFASGSPNSWNDLVSHLTPYYQPYQNINPALPDSTFYLERIDFQDPNGSIDRYDPGKFNPQGNSAGWADKVEIAVNDMLDVNHYGSYHDKVILICHSMGGLAAREYITAVRQGNVAKLVTINTPHAGTTWGNIAQSVNKSRTIGWNIPIIGWSYSAGVAQIDRTFDILKNIDIDGEATVDTAIGSDFLTELNTRIQPNEESLPGYAISAYDWAVRNWFAFHPYYPNSRTELGPWYSGDGVVPIDSQEGFDVILNLGEVNEVWHFNEIERIRGGHSAALYDAPLEHSEDDIDSTFDKILQWIDSEPPEVEVTGVKIEEDGVEEDAPFENGAYQIDTSICILEGVVRKEFFPASSNVVIEAYREGEEEPFETWSNLLKPDDSWIPNDPESIVAGFKEEINFPGTGVYTVKTKVINPAGISSEETTITIRVEVPHRDITIYTPTSWGGGCAGWGIQGKCGILYAGHEFYWVNFYVHDWYEGEALYFYVHNFEKTQWTPPIDFYIYEMYPPERPYNPCNPNFDFTPYLGALVAILPFDSKNYWVRIPRPSTGHLYGCASCWSNCSERAWAVWYMCGPNWDDPDLRPYIEY